MNRLAAERSPYLLQHADNPVDWFPWSDEAFTKARAENKPIFLSIGYSTCHWCHVMAHESFESPDVARVLNEHFVPIKVDREERPDVDRVYMTFVQATTGSGGWPMSVWLTPDLKPFYGGTYFPPASRWGRPGFVEILGEIARVWAAEPEKVRQSAEALTAELRRIEGAVASADVPGGAALQRTLQQFRDSFDVRHGGFGDAPKFPRPSELLFLLREHARTGDVWARDMALATLRAIARGGMCDHIGGGFHRYAVDREWRVPHFEKMLYDQAQLVLAFVEAAQVSGDAFYAKVAEDTLQYVAREMTNADGGFYSAEDADSVPPEHAASPTPHKAEGAFYLWRAEEMDALVGADAALVKERYGVRPDGNAPVDPQQEFAGKNLLYIAQPIAHIADRTGLTAGEVRARIEAARLKLFAARVQRPRPHLDDKVLTCWNGLMIAAFARAARTLSAFGISRPSAARHLEAARRAAGFVFDHLWSPSSGTLRRRFRAGGAEIGAGAAEIGAEGAEIGAGGVETGAGGAEIDGYAEDYAFLVFGLLELFQADPDPRWLDWVETLQHKQDELFWDGAAGGWFSTTGRDPTVLLRMKEDYDGAEPTASSVSVLNLLTLSHLTQNPVWVDRIDRTFRCFGSRLEQAGRAVPMMAAALSSSLAGIRQIVIVSPDETAASDLEATVVRRYLPFAMTIVASEQRLRALASRLPFIGTLGPIDAHPTAYVCRDFTCRAPVTTRSELERELADRDSP